ncbi:MAG: hypothetical protein R3D28_03925 [Geminicoccaceae bacterium]
MRMPRPSGDGCRIPPTSWRAASPSSTAGRSASPISAACRARAGADIGFLDDLFVDPKARGPRASAGPWIEAVAGIARERGWSVVRWLTADDNYRARALYDRLAVKTAWNLYEPRSLILPADGAD